jgi:hypothetical protein
MKTNAFIGKAAAPTADELSAALGATKPVWDQLLIELDQELGVNVHEWKSYSLKAGWSLRLIRKKRTIVWLGPREGAFIVAFILGDKAMQAARASKLPPRIIKALSEATKYPEGTGVRIAMKTQKDIAAVKTLAAIKIASYQAMTRELFAHILQRFNRLVGSADEPRSSGRALFYRFSTDLH